MGPPEDEHVLQWSGIFDKRGIKEFEVVFAVLDSALASASRSGEWRSWGYLTLQIQLAAERLPVQEFLPPTSCGPSRASLDEDPTCDWAKAKAKIRDQIGEIPYMNWFAHTRQVGRFGAQITIAVGDEPSRDYLQAEYGNLTHSVLAELGIHQITWLLLHPDELEIGCQQRHGRRRVVLGNLVPTPISPNALTAAEAKL